MLVHACLCATLLLSSAAASSLPCFTDLVTFGDSYTDVENVSDGGIAWPVYAASYAAVTLHPFARSGATCSSALTPRTAPPVMESQIPAFQNATAESPLNQEQTVYTLWIGTNDGEFAASLGLNRNSWGDCRRCHRVRRSLGRHHARSRRSQLHFHECKCNVITVVCVAEIPAVDDTARAHATLLTGQPSQPLLELRAQHDGMVDIYERACELRECSELNSAACAGTCASEHVGQRSSIRTPYSRTCMLTPGHTSMELRR